MVVQFQLLRKRNIKQFETFSVQHQHDMVVMSNILFYF